MDEENPGKVCVEGQFRKTQQQQPQQQQTYCFRALLEFIFPGFLDQEPFDESERGE